MIDLAVKLDLDKKKKDIQTFLFGQNSEPSHLGHILKSIIQDHGVGIIKDDHKLIALLRAKGCEKSDIYQIMLLIKVDGFMSLIEHNTIKEQSILNIFIRNAIEETGLRRSTILRLTNELAYAFEFAYVYEENTERIQHHQNQAYTIPLSMYQKTIDEYREKGDFKILEPLVAAGIPKAKYYMGVYKLQEFIDSFDLRGNIWIDTEKLEGVQLLQSAADDGDFEAAAELGDFYCRVDRSFTDWNKAYYYYTQYAAMPLTDDRKKAMKCILKQKEKNQKIIEYCFILHLFMTFTSILMVPSSMIFPVHSFISFICIILGFILLCIMVIRFKLQPFELSGSYLKSLFLIWFFYLVARIWF